MVADAQALLQLVINKAAGTKVHQASANLRWAIIGAYQLAVTPTNAPDLARGASLFAQNCAACHGAEGRGDGPAAKSLKPAPSDFHDHARMAQRSVYGLYNTITLGVRDTPMVAFNHLSEDDRWALAFYVSLFPVSVEEFAKAETLWKSGAYHTAFASVQNVATLSANEVKARFGADAVLVQHWLRGHPEALTAGKVSPIQFSIATLRESLAAYTKGDRGAAQQLAATAYLEGFELVERSLDHVNQNLRTEIEREMMAYRNLLKSGTAPEAVATQMNHTIELLVVAEHNLGSEAMSAGATFTASLLILLREGLEAILVLAAIITFLVKGGRRESLPWVHAGWIAAFALGAVTWVVANYVVTISGANRELTEGVTALIAVAMLLYVGFWLHTKAYLHAWQQFIREHVDAALGKKTLWAMATVSFIAVYREFFEIVLFYEALWVQAGDAAHGPLFAGIAVAAVILVVVGLLIFRYGMRLPIGPFFAASSVLIAALAVVFTGQGIAALQEAGVVGADRVSFIRVSELGIFPTVQTLAAQALVAALVVLSFYLASRPSRESNKTSGLTS